ncbi:MAG: carboxymuconolactone decarboxylase family protein [Candidatus Bathyarchaeota archaeon]|nr:carboxymuconolactone decarboxylase family protein [Candidatus Bathyarchaeum tardum]WGM89275.1 MAG: carboxymuconolactone decarboxylase family protein [Candidatus Bathyarchaeum tardum]WNZ28491.1 MAG: carboxymuconolactone decarboxylase family protein [Candidatus Bathyarchaeota archaeon]
MSKNPVDSYREFDPEIIRTYENIQGLAFSEGKLSQKIKILIAMAIDAENGATQGAIVLGQKAIKLGATKQEIIETLRIAYLIGGTKALFTNATVLQTLLK